MRFEAVPGGKADSVTLEIADQQIARGCVSIGIGFTGSHALTACVCGDAPNDHVPGAGCIALVVRLADGREDFCPCMKYEVAP